MPHALGRPGAPRSPARYSPARSRPGRRIGALRSTPACQVTHAARVLQLVPGAFTRFPGTRPSCQARHPSVSRCSGHGPAGRGAGSLSLAGGPRRRRRGRRGRRPVSRRTSSPGLGTAALPCDSFWAADSWTPDLIISECSGSGLLACHPALAYSSVKPGSHRTLAQEPRTVAELRRRSGRAIVSGGGQGRTSGTVVVLGRGVGLGLASTAWVAWTWRQLGAAPGPLWRAGGGRGGG